MGGCIVDDEAYILQRDCRVGLLGQMGPENEPGALIEAVVPSRELFPLSNLWLGWWRVQDVSGVVRYLIDAPAAKRILAFEPLKEAVDPTDIWALSGLALRCLVRRRRIVASMR